ncbi:hypothetical protein CsSME_00042549 [Camellia sinensis var. sinensis]
MSGKVAVMVAAVAETPVMVRHLSHGMSKSWGWAFVSPINTLSKPFSTGKRKGSNKNNTNNNSNTISSLLALGG